MNPLFHSILMGFLRYALTGVFTWMIENGIMHKEQQDQLLVGIAGLLVTLGWMVYRKIKDKKILVTALASRKPISYNTAKEISNSTVAPSATTPKAEVPEFKAPVVDERKIS
jgi:hypothetical protein